MDFMKISNDPRSISVSLNALRAFECATRHLSFTAAADELGITQSAVSHQIKALEDRLNVALFRRTPRGLLVTDEGLALAPTLTDTFDRLARLLSQFGNGRRRDTLTISVVGTFALGWLLPRLSQFEQACPFVDLRLLTNNNRVDVLGEGLDAAIRFGEGNWTGLHANRLLDARMSPVCSPAIAAQLSQPADLVRFTLLRSYRGQDWLGWLKAVGLGHLPLTGPLFDSSILMAEAAARGLGVGLLPITMFENELASKRLVQPFTESVESGSYWLVRPQSRAPSDGLLAFDAWITAECQASVAQPTGRRRGKVPNTTFE